jgi:predicted GIY-YIG superfamily endonuclease
MRGPWNIYILECRDGTYYTGITTDIERRLGEHRGGRGSRYVRARRPFTLVYTETAGDRPSALKREAAIKKMKRAVKMLLVKKQSKKRRNNRR